MFQMLRKGCDSQEGGRCDGSLTAHLVIGLVLGGGEGRVRQLSETQRD